jgi:hypothetical protein
MGLLLALALAVAACSGGGKGNGVASLSGNGSATSTTRAGGDLAQAAVAYGRCLRQHGINVPDPRDGDDVQLPTGIRRNDPRLTAAVQACGQQGDEGGK